MNGRNVYHWWQARKAANHFFAIYLALDDRDPRCEAVWIQACSFADYAAALGEPAEGGAS